MIRKYILRLTGNPPEYNVTCFEQSSTRGYDQVDLKEFSMIHGILLLGIVAIVLLTAYTGIWIYQCSLKITGQNADANRC